MRTYCLDGFAPADAEQVSRVALAAFRQYRDEYADWEGFSERIAKMALLAPTSELIVARVGERVAAAVAYVGPGREKAAFFEGEWAILRMLVVDPAFRGMGIGKALTRACIRRALRDGAPLIALHTSHIMTVALSMYERLGFRFEREAPMIHGVPYGIYVLKLGPGTVDNEC